MMDVELKHTWHVSRRSWFIRLHKWVWSVEDETIDFCKIWWGYVFMWIGLSARLLIEVVTGIVLWIIWMKHLVRGLVRLFRKQQAKETIQQPPPPPPPLKKVDAAWLDSPYPPRPACPPELLKRQKKHHILYVRPLAREIKRILPDRNHPFMHNLLTHIAYTGAWVGMHRYRITYPLGRAAKSVWSGVRLVVKGTVTLGGLMVEIVMLVGLIIVARAYLMLEWALPPVARLVASGFAIFAEALWIASWPMRKTFWYGIVIPAQTGQRLIERLPRRERGIAQFLAFAFIVLGWLAPVVILIISLGFEVIKHPWIAALILGAGCLMLVFGLFVGWLLSMFLDRILEPVTYRYVIRPAGMGIERGTEMTAKGAIGFGRVMLIAIKSVKANTCPKVEIDD